MKTIQEPIIGGFFATLALLLVSFIENISGSFNYISPIFLSSIADDSILGAFFLQLIAGWIFAFLYSLFFIKIKRENLFNNSELTNNRKLLCLTISSIDNTKNKESK